MVCGPCVVTGEVAKLKVMLRPPAYEKVAAETPLTLKSLACSVEASTKSVTLTVKDVGGAVTRPSTAGVVVVTEKGTATRSNWTVGSMRVPPKGNSERLSDHATRN